MRSVNFSSIESLKQSGFTGFYSIGELMLNKSVIPKEPGVYVVVNPAQEKDYLDVGTGGFYKDRNPNVPIDELAENWVDDSIVVYIGKAGKVGSDRGLKARLSEFLNFGQGKKHAPHWGGRLVWQLNNSKELLIGWRIITDEDPREVEVRMIRQFKVEFGKRPFANLDD